MQWGREVLFLVNTDLPDILSDMNFDFENLRFLCFLWIPHSSFRKSEFPKIWSSRLPPKMDLLASENLDFLFSTIWISPISTKKHGGRGALLSLASQVQCLLHGRLGASITSIS